MTKELYVHHFLDKGTPTGPSQEYYVFQETKELTPENSSADSLMYWGELQKEYVCPEGEIEIIKSEEYNVYELPAWERPECYLAWDPSANPVGHFLVYTRCRDACLLENVNYEEILADLKLLDAKYEDDTYVYDFRANCSMAGWIEYIIVMADAPEELQKRAYEILGGLADYPVFDDTQYAERRLAAKEELWGSMSLRDRIKLCQESGASIFAARFDEDWPQAVDQNMQDQVEA